VAVKPGVLLITAGGAVVLWSGVKGHRWTTSLRDIISGQTPQGNQLPIITSQSAYGYGAASSAGSSGAATAPGGTVAKNMAIAKVLALPYGWSTGAQWSALVALWTQESSWSNTARNPSSGAYGIPQALPPSKMPKLALPPVNSAGAQITWGLKYIKDTYGDPIHAEQHEKAVGWY
jgi:hypothetical protein